MEIIIFTAAGALIGGIIGAIIFVNKAKKVRMHFNLNKGMSYEQVIAILGEPTTKRQKGEQLVCQWKTMIEGKYYYIGAVFVNNIAKRIG